MQCSKREPLTFDTKTKEIFFNADIPTSGKDLLEFYKTSEYLSLAPPPKGYTLYPPLSALGPDGRIEHHTFRFKKHPNLSIPIREGELIITTSGKNNTKLYNPPVLKFFFSTQSDMELAYNQLVDNYSKISTRKRFSTYKDTKSAEFTDDNSKSIKGVTFLQGGWDEVAKGYVLVFVLGSEMEIDKQE